MNNLNLLRPGVYKPSPIWMFPDSTTCVMYQNLFLQGGVPYQKLDKYKQWNVDCQKLFDKSKINYDGFYVE